MHTEERTIDYYLPLNSMFDLTGNCWLASEVKEILPDGSYIIRKYTSYDSHPDEYFKTYATSNSYTGWKSGSSSKSHAPKTSMAHMRGLLTEEAYYEVEGMEPVKKTTYEYENDPTTRFNVMGYVPYQYLDTQNVTVNNHISVYNFYSEAVYLKSIHEEGKYNTASEVKYEYHPVYQKPTRIIKKHSDGTTYETRITYPFDLQIYLTTPYFSLWGKNILTPIETTTYKNGKVVSSELTTYKLVKTDHGTIPVPEATYILPVQNPLTNFSPIKMQSSGLLAFDNRYVPVLTNEAFDKMGNVTAQRLMNGTVKSIIKDENNHKILAEITNAVYSPDIKGENQVFYTSFEEWPSQSNLHSPIAKTGRLVYWSGRKSISLENFAIGDYIVSYWEYFIKDATWKKMTQTISIGNSGSRSVSIGSSDMNYLDEVRVHPVGAQMTTYTYTPEGMVLSKSDTNGSTVYYEYDDRYRLYRVRDNDRNLLKEYHYKTRNE